MSQMQDPERHQVPDEHWQLGEGEQPGSETTEEVGQWQSCVGAVADDTARGRLRASSLQARRNGPPPAWLSRIVDEPSSRYG